MTAKCPTRLLEDFPAASDAFGAHQRIAEAIADLVTQEEGGKAIALTGTWGSGKSTVVRILEERLSRSEKGQPETALFVYDTWAHQGDPLRRSFLERLVEFLAECGWVNKGDWQANLDRLSRRLEETDITTQPILTRWGMLVLMALALVPVGGAIVSTADIFAGWEWWIGLVLTAAPLIAALLGWLFKGDTSLSALFVQRTRETQRSTTIRIPDPTSLEFQDFFATLAEDALGQQDRRLVVVMDNLDRVPPEDALQIWSTMRTFFDGGTQPTTASQATWVKRFWLLVPFDRTAITKLWGQRTAHNRQAEPAKPRQAEDDVPHEREEEFAAAPHDDGDDNETGRAFVDKSFQIEFRVPPPVLSRWKDFFLEQFATAFPAHAQGQDGEDIYRLFRRVGLPHWRPLAPRDIKVFINRLGAIHRQRGDEIPLLLQALYALYADRIRNPERDLVRKDFLEEGVKRLVDHYDWRKHLAALYYNVPTDVAYQILIADSVEQSLRTGDYQSLSELRNVPALPTVCDHVLEEHWKDWASSEPNALAASARVLHHMGGEEDDWASCWRWLAKGLDEVQEWDGLNEDAGKGISLIMSHADTPSPDVLASGVLRAIQKDRRLGAPDGENTAEDLVTSWVDGAVEVVGYLASNGFDKLVRKQFRVPGTGTDYIVALCRLAEKPIADSSLCYFLPDIELQTVIEALAQICSSGELARAHVPAIRTMLRIGAQWPWNALLSAIRQRLQASNSPTPEELAASLEALIVLRNANVNEATTTLDALCREGHLMHQLNRVQNQPSFAAFPIMAYLLSLPDGAIHAAPRGATRGRQFYQSVLSNPGASPQVVSELVELSVRLHISTAVLEAQKASSAVPPLVGAILGEIVNRDDVNEHFDADYVIEEFDALSSLLTDERLKTLTKALVDGGGLVDRILSDPPELGDGRLYFLVYDQAEAQGRRKLATALVRKLRAVDCERWHTELEKYGYLARLVVALVEDRVAVDLGSEFQDALLDHARALIRGDVAPGELAHKWKCFPEALDRDRQRTFAKTLWDEVCGKASDGTLGVFLEVCGKYLLENEPPDCDGVVRRVLSPIISRSEVRELAWMERLLTRNPDLLSKAETPTQRDFQGRVETALRKCADENLRSTLERVARAMGLSPEAILADADSEEGEAPSEGEEP